LAPIGRWCEPVGTTLSAAGTPALITQAGRMSVPILERLGFFEVARITVLIDTL